MSYLSGITLVSPGHYLRNMELLTATLVVVTVLHMTSSIEGLEIDIQSHLHHLRTHRYPTKAQEEARKEAKEYIIRKFEEYKLRVHLQHLTAFASPEPKCDSSKGNVEVHGYNIIGISDPGLKDSDSVIVIGVAYDTDGLRDPIHDNGAGVAVMLEIARLYQSSTSWPNYSTLFIAFDLSVGRYRNGCVGDYLSGVPGAWIAVQDYLRLYVSQNTSSIGGGIVLGPLLNVNHEEGSQEFDPTLQKLFPDAYNLIEEGGKRGNFLAMVTKGTDQDRLQYTLGRDVADSFRKAGGRLVELNLGQNPHTLLPSSLPPREAVYFWNSTYMNMESSLPAILLTDTEANRAPQHTPSHTHLLKESQKVFLNTIVSSLVHFLLQRQTEGHDWVEIGLLTTLLASGSINLLLLLHLCHLWKPNCADTKKETLKLKDIKPTHVLGSMERSS